MSDNKTHRTALQSLIYLVRHQIPDRILGKRGVIKRDFARTFGFQPDLEHPRTMAEKLQWLRLHDSSEVRTLAGDVEGIRGLVWQNSGVELHIGPCEGPTSQLQLHYFDGELAFAEYVSCEERRPYHAFLSPDGELLPFQWVAVGEHLPLRDHTELPQAAELDEAIRQGACVAPPFGSYVRVDFLVGAGAPVFEGVSLHNGDGMKLFYPPTAEQAYSELLDVEGRLTR